MDYLTWGETQAVHQHVESVKTFVEKAWAEQAATLREKVREARNTAKAACDAEMREHGYDSLRFADYRAGWLSLENALRTLFGDRT